MPAPEPGSKEEARALREAAAFLRQQAKDIGVELKFRAAQLEKEAARQETGLD